MRDQRRRPRPKSGSPGDGGGGSGMSAEALRKSALETSDSILALQRSAELALRNSEGQLRAGLESERLRAESMRNLLANIVESSDDAIITADSQGIVTSWNRAAESLYGYRAAEAVGRPASILFPAGSQDLETKSGSIDLHQHFETTRVRKDGSLIEVSVTISPLRDGTGEIVGSTRIVRDLTSRRLAAERMRRSHQDLDYFAYIASHDLQAPLRAICGFAELLHRQYGGTLDARADEYLGHLVESAQHMQSLILGVIEYSRVGHGEPVLAPLDAAVPVGRALRHLQAAINEHKAVIGCEPMPQVIGSELELVQLFQNLIGNAIKFHHRDRLPRVTISARPATGGWEISVADNGIGIESRYFDRLFRMFQRLHTPERYEGTGIGLAVCQRIVQRHGGRIWVESTYGEGSAFRFTLPAATPHATPPSRGPASG